jgi:probable rRNA maturation factor
LIRIVFFDTRAKKPILPPRNQIKKWLNRVILDHACICGNIHIIICNDEELHQINLSFLNHDSYTDIITFDESETGVSGKKTLHGELYISSDRIAENAVKYKVSFQQELLRVMVHGILHLCGFSDKTKTQRQQMRNLENMALKLYGNLS